MKLGALITAELSVACSCACVDPQVSLRCVDLWGLPRNALTHVFSMQRTDPHVFQCNAAIHVLFCAMH